MDETTEDRPQSYRAWIQHLIDTRDTRKRELVHPSFVDIPYIIQEFYALLLDTDDVTWALEAVKEAHLVSKDEEFWQSVAALAFSMYYVGADDITTINQHTRLLRQADELTGGQHHERIEETIREVKKRGYVIWPSRSPRPSS